MSDAPVRANEPLIVGLDPSFSSFGVSDGSRHERICTTPDAPREDRAKTIRDGIALFVMSSAPASTIVFVLEGPSYGSAMAGALWDAGYLACVVDALVAQFGAVKYVVPPATLKKFVTGKGNTSAADMPLRVFRKWNIEFVDDPGRDKLHAYCLHRFGAALLAGDVVLEQKPRGQGRKRLAMARTAARTKATVPN